MMGLCFGYGVILGLEDGVLDFGGLMMEEFRDWCIL